LSLTLTIRGTRPFLGTARDVAECVARLVGRSEGEANEIAGAVDTVVAGIVEHAFASGTDRNIELRFDASAETLAIEIGYEGDAAGKLEHALRANGGAQAMMKRGVDRVEFGRSDKLDFCRLTRHFPETT
jgi:hypothetical protein